MSKFEDYTMNREVSREVSENEIFISFNNDWQGEAFQDWLNAEGWRKFAEWLEVNAMDYED